MTVAGTVAGTAARVRGVPVGRILLAEDNPTNQLIVATLLRRAGYAVDVAGDGAEAVSVLLTNGADLVLMDVQMPGLDGFEAARAIRAMGELWARIPIVALTADSMPETQAACRAAGMDDHAAKPVRPPTLLSMVERWLARSGAPGSGAPGSGAPDGGRAGRRPRCRLPCPTRNGGGSSAVSSTTSTGGWSGWRAGWKRCPTRGTSSASPRRRTTCPARPAASAGRPSCGWRRAWR